MREKHRDCTEEWQKLKQALQAPKTKSLPTTTEHKETKDDKKDTQ